MYPMWVCLGDAVEYHLLHFYHSLSLSYHLLCLFSPKNEDKKKFKTSIDLFGNLNEKKKWTRKLFHRYELLSVWTANCSIVNPQFYSEALFIGFLIHIYSNRYNKQLQLDFGLTITAMYIIDSIWMIIHFIFEYVRRFSLFHFGFLQFYFIFEIINRIIQSDFLSIADE